MNPQDPNQVPVQPVQDPNMMNGQMPQQPMMGQPQMPQQPMMGQPQMQQQPMYNQMPQGQAPQQMGTPMNGQQQFYGAPQYQQGAKPDTGMCILCYFGILSLIPYLSKKEDPYMQFHSKCGLNIFIVYFAVTIGLEFIASLTRIWAIGYLSYAFGILVLVLEIMGISNACSGKMTTPPLADKIKIIK